MMYMDPASVLFTMSSAHSFNNVVKHRVNDVCHICQAAPDVLPIKLEGIDRLDSMHRLN